ncbi:F420-non-reducing hydrogenase subunit A [Desulfurobacterium pacificum]|uniref:F420-non-reducing hydrogenase subunit A n=1 Tax=Desulfurobacterium pacificum TaxID=240166 RepID=A0ABY1NEK2_9BACT|nr:Ni/Fe hydrogenase subunit alpha [Desulfurobacterium pacificum]SMP07756.1 F420-non-reducing hydrogenase subunit A [Desulfurobacterium pacificum]
MRKAEIEPITRLEGHGKITVFLDDNGNVENAFLQVVEFMGYEKFLQGMPIEEVPRTASTICGVCRAVHFSASLKAADQIFSAEPPPAAKKIRQLLLLAHHIEDHTEILYALGLPDFICGPTAPPQERNLIGVAKRVGKELVKDILQKRFSAAKIVEILGGKPVHPVAAVPGGWAKKVTEEEKAEIEKLSDDLLELGKMTVELFKEIVVKNPEYSKLLKEENFNVVTNYMATVDENNKVTYYHGTQVVVSPEGKEIVRFTGKEYLDVLAEKTLPWSYAKFPYLKQKGWKGLEDGKDTHLISVGPLARFNASEGYSTPLAQKAYEEMVEFFGGKPVYNIFAYHWARAIEILNQAELIKELLKSPELTDEKVVTPPGKVTGEGVGIVEAPRGTLIHHYWTDENGFVTDANLIVPTTINNGAIQVAVRKAAKYFIKDGKVDEGTLNLIEMAHRPYDLCLACATHAYPGHYPTNVIVYRNGKRIKELRNY